MKRITLFRHAKTEAESGSGRDFDRGLLERGQADARRMGQEIRRAGLKFDLVLASPARRAVQTAETAGFSPRLEPRIYNAATGDLLDLVRETDDSVGSLAMIGHNPGFERLASMLAGQELAMPTGSLVQLDLPIGHWTDAGEEPGTVSLFLAPSQLDQA